MGGYHLKGTRVTRIHARSNDVTITLYSVDNACSQQLCYSQIHSDGFQFQYYSSGTRGGLSAYSPANVAFNLPFSLKYGSQDPGCVTSV
jgi:hypothetical protein